MEKLLEDVEKYVISFLKENLSAKLGFHSLSHTLEVVAAAKEIGQQCHLSENEMDVLLVAAWFHDCGYVHTYIGHEEESKRIAKSYLEEHNCNSSFISSVLACIDATRFPQSANSTVEKVLCDADLHHFTKSTYPQYAQAIRKEFEIFLRIIYSEEEWQKINTSLLTAHKYCTEYGKSVLSRFKDINIEMINRTAQ